MNKLPLVISTTPSLPVVEEFANKIPSIPEMTKLLKKGSKLKPSVIKDLLILSNFSKSASFIDSLIMMRGYLNLLKTNLTNKQVTRLLKNNKELMEIFM